MKNLTIGLTLTLDSRDVARMIDKQHAHLLREIEVYRGYLAQSKIGLSEKQTDSKIPLSDFWQESTYTDSTGRTLKNYQITRKGCEFIAHKLTGKKGAIFTANYINKFHEMEKQIQKPVALPATTIKRFKYKGLPVMSVSDIAIITSLTQGSIRYHMKQLNIPHEHITGIALRNYKIENGIPNAIMSALTILTKSSVVKLCKELGAYTSSIKNQIDEYFNVLPRQEVLPISENILVLNAVANSTFIQKANEFKDCLAAASVVLGQTIRNNTKTAHDARIDTLIDVASEIVLKAISLRRIKLDYIPEQGTI